MNILYLCDEYPPGLHGGIGTSVQLLAREMVKQGNTVIVAGFYSLGYGSDDEFEDEGVKVYRFRKYFDSKFFSKQLNLAPRIISWLLKHTRLTQLDIKRSLIAYGDELKKIIADHKIDIIEMPDYNDYIRHCKSFVPFPALPVPVVIKMNGSMTYFIKELNGTVPEHVLRMEKVIINNAAAVASVSRYTAEKSAAYFSYGKPIEVIPNGVDTDLSFADIKRDLHQVVFTGSLVQKKGIYQLAKAWNTVIEHIPDARLLIVGNGSKEKVLANLTSKATSTVSFIGHVSSEKLYTYLTGSAISIFPSYAEAFALAPLEAMVCGTAVINSNRTSGPELITDKVNGLLVDPDDIEQMASAIMQLINNPGMAIEIAEKGNLKVKESFDIAIIAKQNLKFYRKVLDSYKDLV